MTSRIRVRVHPGAKRERIEGFRADGALAIEVTAAPDRGRANDAVVRLMSKALGVSRAAVTVAGGTTSRSKWIEVEGLTMTELQARITAVIAATDRSHGE